MARPSTSKPRGVCRYYASQHGCFAGAACKFLHPDSSLTPYDQSKRCKFYAQGFCRRGDQCWFKHTVDVPSADDDRDSQNDPCSICFEMPVTYGLLSGCSHIFCITCIRQWRDQKGAAEQITLKRCPMCREPSKFITPSSRFYKHGHPEKERITQAYKESMGRVSCRYFQRSLQRDENHPICPFGKDCFYQHLKRDGTPFIFDHGADVCMRRYHNSFPQPSTRLDYDVAHFFPSEWVPLTVNVLREAMETLESAVSASSETVVRTLNVVRLLVNRDLNNNNTEQVENPSNEMQDDHTTISDHSDEVDPESDSDDEISQLGRYIRSTRYDEADNEDERVEEETPDNDDDDPAAIEEVDSGRVTNPPFLTDGRGRVVWSGNSNNGDVVDDDARPGEGRDMTECSGRSKNNNV
ncbi:hypothetical protein Agabi119p4_6533 [Agaricus bisporus var. burnettii]|uniref:RING-type E3 ubiquitin transferase n=1 Tax=Agaricus bisporus var. burnettii TaxID=192524 RepID=A0A8H7EZV4_AGABI|nr:hypothetical protein Agabi119p4_6533 [Agaricus bisporus var. burnettii]